MIHARKHGIRNVAYSVKRKQKHMECCAVRKCQSARALLGATTL